MKQTGLPVTTLRRLNIFRPFARILRNPFGNYRSSAGQVHELEQILTLTRTCQPISLSSCRQSAQLSVGTVSAQSMRLFRGRTALRFRCSRARRLALLHLLLLSGMLLLDLLRLLRVPLLHLLSLRLVVVFRGGLLMFFFLLLLESLMVLLLFAS
jgi:hypothetical protein